jgi:hypothetical protein
MVATSDFDPFSLHQLGRALFDLNMCARQTPWQLHASRSRLQPRATYLCALGWCVGGWVGGWVCCGFTPSWAHLANAGGALGGVGSLPSSFHVLSPAVTPSHTRTHARTHARTCTRTHACTCTHADTRTHARMHARTRTQTHPHTHTHARARARTHAHAHTHARTRTHARTCTHTHTRTLTRVGASFPSNIHIHPYV